MTLEDILNAARAATGLADPTHDSWREGLELLLRDHAKADVLSERGWTSLHQILATRPDGKLESGKLRGAQSSYPFNREYMYRDS